MNARSLTPDHTPDDAPTFTVLRTLVNLLDNSQKQRIGLGNHLGAMRRGDSNNLPDHALLLERWEARFKELEESLLGEIKFHLKEHPVYPYLREIHGMGPALMGKLLAPIDIRRADTVSALWRYAGQGVNEQGERDRPRKGETLNYNARLKTVCYLIGVSFIKTNSPYRLIYDRAKSQYQATRVGRPNDPDWTDAHIHMASMRKMVKVFLSHLWQVYRTVEGLPTRELYVLEVLKHTHEYKPEEFGWQSLEAIKTAMEGGSLPGKGKRGKGKAVAAADVAVEAKKRGRTAKADA